MLFSTLSQCCLYLNTYLVISLRLCSAFWHVANVILLRARCNSIDLSAFHGGSEARIYLSSARGKLADDIT